ncbi:MAG: hypothetical protein Q8O43_10760 [Dehalococcoidia bacterium]|nr:hypothetical protein [Dehalococcoidia bacterium]
MAVKVVDKKTKKEATGKWAAVKGGEVHLWSGIMSDKKGGWRGCGRKTVFPATDVNISADEPAKELKKG